MEAKEAVKPGCKEPSELRTDNSQLLHTVEHINSFLKDFERQGERFKGARPSGERIQATQSLRQPCDQRYQWVRYLKDRSSRDFRNVTLHSPPVRRTHISSFEVSS